MEFYIYKITNKINNKSYVGRTKFPSRRFSQHAGKKGKSCISKAIRKYGITNFKFEVIEVVYSLKESIEKESFHIDFYKSLVPKGYNLSKVTDQGSIWHKDTRLKIQQYARNLGKSGFIGVYKEERNGLYECNININSKRYGRYFYSAIEAAEGYDKLALYGYGEKARFNFPNKISDYEKEDLEVFIEKIANKEKSSSYIGVSFLKSVGKWRALVYDDNKKQINLGCYASEIEAAEARDKCVLFLKMNRELNFPNKKEYFISQNLESFYLLNVFKKTSKYKGISFDKKTKKWKAYDIKNRKSIHLGYFETELEAFESREKYLKNLDISQNNSIIKL